MAFVGEAVLTAFIETLFDKLSSSDLLHFARQEQVLADINKWENTLLKIQAVLDDAEEKQLTSRRVKMWLDDLRNLAYDVEDILDDFATEALGRKVMAETQSSTSKVRVFIPSCCTSFTPTAVKFNVKMRSKIEDITSRLQYISAQQNDLLLTTKISGKRSTKKEEIMPTTCLIDESRVCGRETDKAAIVDLLLHDHERSDDAVRVIPIIGMGGVGKTTLAQLAYNNDKVESHFDLRVWACVSDDFDVLRVTRTILQSVASDISNVKDLNQLDLNQLQVKLKEGLSGKMFLLVLDDVWNQNCDKWDILYTPLRTGAKGSRVIVTTRNQGVVSAIGASSAYPLRELSNDECLSLFAQQALGIRDFDNHPRLRVVGEEIVKKCKGLPLAAKALGGMLRTKLNDDAWEDILKSKIWDLPEENNSILPALKLSYHHLPSHLKRCFAYCSIFPKDYEFKVDDLVLLWMGEGFLGQLKGQKQMEEIGTEFFHELLARSFFQQSNCKSSQFVMHDLVHDLAQLVAGDTCFNLEDKLENNEKHTISERARHSSFIHQTFEIARKFEVFGKVKNLRTFVALPTNIQGRWETGYISPKVLHELLSGMRCLRVLSLADYYVREVPDSISKLKHLRYLNFSNCSIKDLPDSVSDLYNLQTLILRDCNKLIRLPKGIGKLINLRHLDIVGTSGLQEISFQVGNLTNLQTLSKFIVSKSGGSRIGELKNLSSLQGMLSISKLHEIVNVKDARDANLKNKQKMVEIIMEWNDEFWDSRNGLDELQVLESLQPHKNLEKLIIAFYGGSKFPSWIGDSFSKMVSLALKDCKKCSLLPTIGGLPFLEILHIQGMEKVKSIGAEFYGECKNPFATLKELRFEDMPEWESWSHSNLMKENITVFPNLKKFVIRKCPKLMGELPKCLQSLVKLDVSECPELVCGLPELASLHELNLEECDEAMLRGDEVDLRSLATLQLKRISRLNCLSMSHTRSLVALQELVIKDCGGLTCLWEEQGVLCNLKVLRIEDCAELEKLPNGLQISVMRLEELEVRRCPKLETFLEAGLPPMLRRLVVRDCGNLKGLPPPHSHNYNNSVCALEFLEIISCPSLRCFPNGGLASTLKKLSISNCENLESLPVAEGMGMNMRICALEYLSICHCRSLKSFPKGELPSTLKRLVIWYCSNLESMSENMCPNNSVLEYLELREYPNLRTLPECLNSLKELWISDCEGLECFPARGFLTPNLTVLDIEQCQNLKSLSHEMRTLKSLLVLSIRDCPGMESFPKEGLAPNLTSLFVDCCENLKTPISEWGLQSLTSLSSLTVSNMFPDMVSFPDEERLFPSSLASLTINRMASLTSLTLPLQKLDSLTLLQLIEMESLASLSLQNLTSLQSLYISYCPNLTSLALFPATLETLDIFYCPIIKEKCLKDKGEYWPNIANIPLILLDMKYIH